MQQPASRAVKAARKRGVHAEGLRAYLSPSADGVSSFALSSCHVALHKVCCLISLLLSLSLTYQWPADVLLARVVHDEDVVRLHKLFFYARGREEDVVLMLD